MIWGRLEGSQGSFWAGDGVKLVSGWKAALKAAVWCRPEGTWQGVGSKRLQQVPGSSGWVEGAPKRSFRGTEVRCPLCCWKMTFLFLVLCIYLFFFPSSWHQGS